MWPRDSFKTTARNLCGLFLSVFDEKVFFIHQTAREFLTGQSEPSYEWKGSFNMPGAHSKMAFSCISLLSLHDLIMDDKSYNGTTSFMAYAAENWVTHYNSQDDAAKYKSSQAARQLCRTAWGRAQIWARKSFTYPGNYPLHASDCTDLTLASYLGLIQVVEHIVQIEKVDVNSEGGYFGTAIKAAAAGGHLERVQTLLRHGANCNVGGGYFQTALEAAHGNGNWEIAEFLRQQGEEITQGALAAAAGGSNLEGQIADLIDNFGDEFRITEEVIEAAASNSYGGSDIITLVLEERGHQFEITNRTLEEAAGNLGCGEEIINLLIEERGEEFEITDNAAGNLRCGKEIMDLLLENYGDRFSVTSAMIESAASSTCGTATIELLLEKRGHEFQITPQTVLNAAVNVFCGVDILRLLLDLRGDETKITEETIMAAAEKGSQNVMEFLLVEHEHAFELSTELILAVARNGSDGGQIMAWLFERYGDEVIATQDVLVAAAGATDTGEILAVLLMWRGNDLKVTEAVVVAAAGNRQGEAAMAFLLRERGSGFTITQNVVSAAEGNESGGRDIMDLLYEQRWDEVIMY